MPYRKDPFPDLPAFQELNDLIGDNSVRSPGKDPSTGGKSPQPNPGILEQILQNVSGAILGDNKPNKKKPRNKAALNIVGESPFDFLLGKDNKNRAPASNKPNPMGGKANIAKPGSRRLPRQFRNQVQRQVDNGLEQLFSQLVASVGSGSPTFDYESALQESQQAIRQAYRNDIDAVRGSNKAARRDTAKNRQELESLYAALARSYNKAGGRAMEQGQDLAAQMQEISGSASDSVNQSAQQIAQEQAAMAQGLGIEAAMPDIMQSQGNELQEDLTQIADSGAQSANTQLSFAGNQQRFMERGSQGARLEGTNRSADLLADLQDFIQGNRQQVSQLRSQRSRDISANETSVMNSIAEMQAAAEAQQWERLMGLADMKLDIENTQQDNDLASAEFRAKLRDQRFDHRSSLADRELDAQQTQAQLQQELMLAQMNNRNDPQEEESFMPSWLEKYSQFVGQELGPRQKRLMNSVTNSDQFTQGQMEAPNGSMIDLTPNAAAQFAKKKAIEQGITDPALLAEIGLAAMLFAQGGF